MIDRHLGGQLSEYEHIVMRNCRKRLGLIQKALYPAQLASGDDFIYSSQVPWDDKRTLDIVSFLRIVIVAADSRECTRSFSRLSANGHTTTLKVKGGCHHPCSDCRD